MSHLEESSDSESEPDTGQFKKWSKNAFGEHVPAGGTFTDEESAMVKAAAIEFCSNKQITISSLGSGIDHRKHHKGLWVEIAKKVPHRSVVSVYRHGIRILHPFKRGEWTSEEENILIECVVKYGKKWSRIQRKLNRTADSCRDKYRAISGEYDKGKWNDEDWQKLLRLVRDFLNVDKDTNFVDMIKLVNARKLIIPWDSLSRKMVNRARLSCFRKWHSQIKKYFAETKEKSSKKQKKKKREKSASSINEDDYDSETDSDSILFRQEKLTKKKKQKREKSSEVDSDSIFSRQEKSTKKKQKKREKSASGSGCDDNEDEKHRDATNSRKDNKRQKKKQKTLSSLSIESNDLSKSKSRTIADESWSCDKILLERLASSSYKQIGSVPWASIHHPLGDPMDRWNELCDEFYAPIDDPNVEDEFSDKPLWELAQLILETKNGTKP